ncbi:hypothetical protein ACJ72_08794, partial [Emergomyces africanus]
TLLMTRLNHLEKQEEFLKKRAGKFLESDTKSLEKLKKLKEKKEKQHKTQIAQQHKMKQLLVIINDFPFALSDSQLAQLNQPPNFVDETVESSVSRFAD